MIPLRDDIPSRRLPLMNYAIIAFTSVVFLLQLGLARDPDRKVEEKFGMIPLRVMHPHQKMTATELVQIRGRVYEREREIVASPIPNWLTLLTCIFLHGGWLHFLGNMWFLFIFGDNVEDRLGRALYLFFYLISGVAASFVHLITNTGSGVPTVGASGAIAGVMGAYFVLFPHARVLSIVPLFVFVQVVNLPASLFLGIWFVIQFFQGTLAITSSETGGVAWWAHIGGFAVGFLVGWLFKQRPEDESPRTAYRQSSHTMDWDEF
ncbi:MAG: hypothetical protein RIS70_4375 [Planctomycetota bacterium]|jgi:membrane associated rhomboid family serine protease